MLTWVSLLRGVNVNGITVRSADLAEVYRALGFEDVRTVLASGNVRGRHPATIGERPALKATVETALRDRFGYDAWIVLITLAELQEAVAGFPFDPRDPGRQPYVVFASDPAVIAELTAASDGLDPVVDPVLTGTSVLYWNPVTGTSVTTPFARILARPRFRTTTTQRNLRTLVKILG